MKRLTIKKVQAAYKKIGLKPCHRVDVVEDTDGKITNCCPAVAVGKAVLGQQVTEPCFLVDDGYDPDYVDGFVTGVDSPDRGFRIDLVRVFLNEKKYQEGWEDGQEVWSAIKPPCKKRKAK